MSVALCFTLIPNPEGQNSSRQGAKVSLDANSGDSCLHCHPGWRHNFGFCSLALALAFASSYPAQRLLLLA